ncbi:flagellar filament capping protein FliD [Paraburkholderia dioscoreae]|nr:flagellar filament capping protein FliD [Paraburkholderia dioscoreae]
MSTVSTASAAATTAANNAALQQAAQSIISGSTGNSSLDVSSLVTALVNSKTAGQLSALTAQQTADNTKISAVGTLKAALSALQASLTNLANGKTLASYTATASGSGLSATAGVGAVAGSYAIAVSQIAQAQTISSSAFSATAPVGTGTLNVSLGGQPMSVTIDSTNNTLSGIASAINSAANNPGVSATVVTGTDGAHLVLRSASTGAANTISISSSDAGLSSLGVTSSPVLTSGTFSSSQASQALGTGTMTISVGGKSTNLTIDGTNNTLQKIADAITNADLGVTANVVSSSSGSQQLVVTSSNGSSNSISITTSGVANDQGLSSLGSMVTTSAVTSTGGGAWKQPQSAQDALFTVDGTPVSSSTNSSTTAIAGVTLNLTAAALGTTSSSGTITGNAQTLTIASDTTSQATAITNFVSLYNTLVTTMGTLTSFDSTQAQGSQAGPLLGDSMTNTIENSLASIVSGGVKNGNVAVTLASIGITLNADGSMTTDSTALNNALTNSPATVASLFNSTNGVAAQLNNSITNFTQTGGIMDTETTAINADLTSIASQQTTLAAYTAQLTSQYQAQFTALNTLMATMNNNSQYLTQLFGGTNSAGALANGKS